MSTKYRFRDKYRIQLREKDHLPPHVHLTGGGVDVLICLHFVVVIRGDEPPSVLQEALSWIRVHQHTVTGGMGAMASMKRPRLQAVQVMSANRLALTFINGQQFTLDLSNDLADYPGLHPLQRDDAFADAQLGDDGWTVEWPQLDIQLGADTLYLDAQAQNTTDENTRIFIAWRARTGLPLAQAAQALGVSTRSITRYSNARESTPRTLTLACLGWDALQHQTQTLYRAAEEPTAYAASCTAGTGKNVN